jgi:hypothetical protein
LRKRERHANRGLNSWVQKLGQNAQPSRLERDNNRSAVSGKCCDSLSHKGERHRISVRPGTFDLWVMSRSKQPPVFTPHQFTSSLFLGFLPCSGAFCSQLVPRFVPKTVGLTPNDKAKKNGGQSCLRQLLRPLVEVGDDVDVPGKELVEHGGPPVTASGLT